MSSSPSGQTDEAAQPGAFTEEILKDQARQAWKLADAAQQIGGHAKETAKSLASEAGERAQGYANQQIVAAADLVEETSKAIRVAADELGRTSPTLAGLVRGAADNFQSISREVRNKNAEEILASARDIVRRRPALVFGAAAGLGFLAFRLLNAGRPRETVQHRERSSEDEHWPLQPSSDPIGTAPERFASTHQADPIHGR
jgi:hypothetical protein